MRQKCRSRGFTLIEILVVMAVIAAILVSVTTILFNSFRARARIELADGMEEEGNIALREIKSNLVAATSEGMSVIVGPAGVGNSMSFTSVRDGNVTSLVCIEGVKIASVSALGSFDLTSPQVSVSGCNDFVRGDTMPGSPGKVANLDFSFVLSKGNAAEGSEHFVSRTIRSGVVVRN